MRWFHPLFLPGHSEPLVRFKPYCYGNTPSSRPPLSPMRRVPPWKDEQFLSLLKQALLTLRKEQLQRLFEGPTALPSQS